MKTTIGILLCLILTSCEQISAPNENKQGQSYHLRQDAYPSPDSTFNIENETHLDVGVVTIHLNDNSNATIDVTGIGNFTTHIAAATTICEIHGHQLQYSVPTWVPIDSNTLIHATWSTNVIVIDQSEVN